MANNDVLGNMFTSFVDGKKNTHISRSHYGSAFHRLPARGRNQSDIHFLLNPPLPPMQTEHVVHHVPRNNRSRPREYESNNHQQKILPSAHRQTPPNQSPEVLGSKLRHEKSNSRMSSSKRGVSGSASGIKKFHMKNGGNVVQSRGRATDSSVMPGRKSSESVEAIAVDSTVVPTPYHCEKCSKAFRQRSQLSRHFSRVHERRKPFACAHCDKCFASAFDRKRHVEAVHGRRCIECFCDRCSFRSKEQKDLDKHIREVHERDQCRLCGKIFKRPANLVAHERHYHSQKI